MMMCDAKLAEMCYNGKTLFDNMQQAYTSLVENCDELHYQYYVNAKRAMMQHHASGVDDVYFLNREGVFRKLLWTSMHQIGLWIKDCAEVWEKDARAEWFIRHACSYEDVYMENIIED